MLNAFLLRTSLSAFLTIGVGASGWALGVKGIPSAARTALFGGGTRVQVMKRTALIGVFAVV